MKLISCYVSSFGKLKDFKYDFTDGLNTIKEENGWGKSTFAGFIKAMFYGLNSTEGKHDLSENERKRFAPWNSTERFGGYVVFETDGKPYKIERFFGSKRGEETVKLYDLTTNRSFTDDANVKELGKRIFKIDEDGFLSTTYFSQKEFEVKSSPSITAKYNETCQVQGQESFDKAVVEIENEMKKIKVFRGEKGKIFDVKREISDVAEKIATVKQAISSVGNLDAECAELQSQCDKLRENIKKLTDDIEIAGRQESAAIKKRTYDGLVAEKSELLAKKSATDRLLGDADLSDDVIKDCETRVNDYGELTVREKSARADLENLTEAGDKKEDAKPKKPNKLSALVYAIAFVLFAAGIVLSFTVGVVWLTLVAAGFVVAVINILLSGGKKTDKTGDEKSAFLVMAEMKKTELDEIVSEREKLKNGLESFFAAFDFGEDAFKPLTYSDKLHTIRRAADDRNDLIERIDRINEKLRELGKPQEMPSDGKVYDVGALKSELKTATEWLNDKITLLEKKKNRIESIKDQAENLLDLESRQKELRDEYAELEKEYRILSLTNEHLKLADETLKTRYRAPLQESLNKYLAATGVKFGAIIDTEMNITVEVSGAGRESDYFSKGYRNLFEICKRFALTDVLFTAEKPFIILDDPFYDLDDEKLALALALIKKLSEEYQILYLVCHESRRA